VIQPLDNTHETCYNVSSADAKLRVLVLAIHEAALIIARGCEDYLGLDRTRPSRKEAGRRE
jgi:hypothetical protein